MKKIYYYYVFLTLNLSAMQQMPDCKKDCEQAHPVSSAFKKVNDTNEQNKELQKHCINLCPCRINCKSKLHPNSKNYFAQLNMCMAQDCYQLLQDYTNPLDQMKRNPRSRPAIGYDGSTYQILY
jgi:hypothetical protein